MCNWFVIPQQPFQIQLFGSRTQKYQILMKKLFVLTLACLLSINAIQTQSPLIVSDQISGPDFTASVIDGNQTTTNSTDNTTNSTTESSSSTSNSTADPTNSTVDPTNTTNSTVDPTNTTNSTVEPTNTTNSTVDPTNTTNSTVDPTNTTNSTVEPTNSSASSNTTNSTTDNSTSNSTIEPSGSNSSSNSSSSNSSSSNSSSSNSSTSSNTSNSSNSSVVPSGSNSSSGGDVTPPVNPTYNTSFQVNFSSQAAGQSVNTGTGVVFNVNPAVFSNMSVFNVQAQCANNSDCTNAFVTNQLQQQNFTAEDTLYNLTQCSNSTNGQIICQNTTGVWSFDSNRHLKKIVDFASVGQKKLPTACQALFPEVYTQYMTSICTIDSTTWAYAYDQTGSNKLELQVLNSEITQFFYMGGFFFAFNSTDVVLGALQFATKNNQTQQIMVKNVTGLSNFSPVNISVGLTSSYYQNPTLGFFYRNDSVVNVVNTTVIENKDGTFTTINSTNITGQWELALFLLAVKGGASSNPTSGIRRMLEKQQMTISAPITAQAGTIAINFSAILNVSEVTTRFSILNPQANLSLQIGYFVPQQLIQSGLTQSDSTLNKATFQFPFVAVWENNVVGISMNISSLNEAQEVVQCYYSTPNSDASWVAQPQVSAYQDMVVVPFVQGPSLGYALYQSTNPLAGGDNRFACANNNTLNVSSTFIDYHNGAIQPATILPIGTILGVNGTNQLFELQVNPYYGFAIDSDSKETSLIVTIQEFNSSTTALFTFNTTSTLTYEYTRPGFVGLYFGLIIAGLVILLGTLGFLCIQSTEKARMQALLS